MTDAQRKAVEADLRAYPDNAARLAQLRAEIDDLRLGLAARALPWPDGDQPRASGTNHISDHVPVAVQQLWSSPQYREYQRLEPLVRAIETAYKSLDEAHRKVLEAYYWGWPEARAALGISRTALYHRRMQICRVTLRALRDAGIQTYADPGGVLRADKVETA
ncbi:MAG: hypothetical protein IMW98_08470 [Firmicutes bacterium]|nr:hypothetical protein [Bacillota bacterium]MBE3590839.1 hypothetical protein [Bacillota bacterium]